MSSQEIWATIALMTVATIVTRGSFFLLGNAVRLPPKVRHALRYAPAAALAAIVAPDLLTSAGAVDVSVANPKLWAGVGAAVFFITVRHLLGTIVVGMTLFTALRLLA